MTRSLKRCTVAAAIVATAAAASAGAQTPTSTGPVVATNVSQIPTEWTLLASAHPCMANPWGTGCPHPPTSIVFPSRPQLQSTLTTAENTFGTANGAVTSDAGGPLLATAKRPGSPDAVAAKALANCLLEVGSPEIVGFGGDDYARGISDVGCPIGYIEATVTDDLYRDGVFLAADSDSSFAVAPYALATALYNCHHATSHPYSNVGLWFVERTDGTAATNTATFSNNHTCPT